MGSRESRESPREPADFALLGRQLRSLDSPCYPALMGRFRPAAVLALAIAALGATALLPARVELVARAVEEVRGKRFARSVPASEIGEVELKRVLKPKIGESFPTSPADTMRTLVAFGLIDETSGVIDKLVDFYSSQVIAFYDPEPRRFYVVRGAGKALESGGIPGMEGMAEKLIFAHELTHALQDESMGLDARIKALKDDGDRGLALQSLLEGEATLVMVRVAIADLPGDSDELEESLEPLLSAGALEKANVPRDLPPYFVDQLFFPYVEGTAYVRRTFKKGGWKEVDRLWKNPPRSTSEILHDGLRFDPAADLLTADGAKLAPAGSRYLYSDTLGEWTVRFLLRRTLPQDEADEAAAGWRGDRIAFYGSGSAIAYLWRTRFEGPAAAERFEGAWKKARKTRKELVYRKGGDVFVVAGFEKPPA